jgi:predicted Zn-dependent protease
MLFSQASRDPARLDQFIRGDESSSNSSLCGFRERTIPAMTLPLKDWLVRAFVIAPLFIVPLSAQTTTEKGLGNVVDAELLRSNVVLLNSPIQDELQQIVNDLGQQAKRPDMTFTVRILCNPSINAYATSGGYIYVHTGLLDFLSDRNEVAAVLAHEVHHAATSEVLHEISGERNGLKRAIEREAITFGWISLGALAGAAIDVKGGGIPKGIIIGKQTAVAPRATRGPGGLITATPAIPAKAGVLIPPTWSGLSFTQLGSDLGERQGALAAANAIAHFSAQIELDADKAAVDYLANTGYDPNVLMDVMKKFKALKNDENNALSRYRVGWVEKKPGLDERMQKVRDAIEARRLAQTQPKQQ